MLKQQIVMRDKLKKIKMFIEGLKGGATFEKDHEPMLNVNIEENRLYDIETEVETMIQMTYLKPCYD